MQEAQTVRRAAIEIERLDKGCLDTQSAIVSLENELRETGSVETTEDVQAQVTVITNEMSVSSLLSFVSRRSLNTVCDSKAVKSAIEQKRNQLNLQNRQAQATANTIHQRELDLSQKKEKLREKIALEKRRDDAKADLVKAEASRLVRCSVSPMISTLMICGEQELDEKIREAQAPSRKLENDIAEARAEFQANESIAVRQQAAFNKNLESLDSNAKELKSCVSSPYPVPRQS